MAQNRFKIERFSSKKKKKTIERRKKKKSNLELKKEPVWCGPEGNKTCLSFFLTCLKLKDFKLVFPKISLKLKDFPQKKVKKSELELKKQTWWMWTLRNTTKYDNNFTNPLFSVVVAIDLVFFYFILYSLWFIRNLHLSSSQNIVT